MAVLSQKQGWYTPPMEGYKPPTGAKAERTPEPPSPLSRVREILRERFVETENPDNQLPYHGIEHSEGVVRRALLVAEALGATEHEKRLIEVAAAFHDTVQEWEESKLDNGVVKRKRLLEKNEDESAREALAWMAQYPGQFSAEDQETVRKAVIATVPSFDVALKTVVQPNHDVEADNVSRAVALADLGTAGMEPEVFAKEGTQLFAEENLDIVRAIRSGESIPSDVQQSYLKRYQDWMDFQVTFADGRRFDTISNFFEYYGITKDPERGAAMRTLFSRFDESIELAKKNAEEARALTFEELAKRLVPKAFAAANDAESA